MITPSEIARIHQVLTRHDGNREAAAAELGLGLVALTAKLVQSAELKALWQVGRPVTVEEAYNRDAPVGFDLVDEVATPEPGLTQRAIEISNAFHQQEVKLQKFDWEGLGIGDPKTLSLMNQFERGVGRGVLRMMDAMQGGMAYCFAKVSRQFADVSDLLEAEQAKPVDGAGMNKRDENRIMFLHARFMDLAKEMQKFNNEAVKAANTRLQIADRAKKIQQAGNRLRMPTLRRATPMPVNPEAERG